MSIKKPNRKKHIYAQHLNAPPETVFPLLYPVDELVARDKASLDIFWLMDESLEDSKNLPEPCVIAAEIVEDLESALEQMRLIAGNFGGGARE